MRVVGGRAGGRRHLDAARVVAPQREEGVDLFERQGQAGHRVRHGGRATRGTLAAGMDSADLALPSPIQGQV